MAGGTPSQSQPNAKGRHSSTDVEPPAPRTPRFEDIAEHSGQPSTAWWRGVAIGAAGFTFALGLLALIWLLARPLALLFGAIVIAQSVAPIVGWLDRWIPRIIAIALVYLAILLTIGGVGWIIFPPLVDQTRALIPEDEAAMFEQWESWVNEWIPGGGDRIIEAVEGSLNIFAGFLVQLPLAIITSATEIILVLVMSAYWLVAMPSMHRFIHSLVPERGRARIGSVLSELGDTVGGYVRGVVIDGFIVAVVVYIGLSIIGVQFPLVLALVAFFGELVPVAGPIIAAIPAIAIALLESPTQALIVLIFYVVLQQIESNLLLPNIMHNQAHVPPVLGVFAFFAGAAIGGLLGAIIAMPIAGALRVIVNRVVAPAVRQWSGMAETEAEARHPREAA